MQHKPDTAVPFVKMARPKPDQEKISSGKKSSRPGGKSSGMFRLFNFYSLLPLNLEYNAIGPVVLINNFSACFADNRFYFTGHCLVTEKTESFTHMYSVQTCPHVLQAPSAIAPIVDINSNSFPHRSDFFRLAIFFFRFFLESRRASARRSAASSMSCSCELR